MRHGVNILDIHKAIESDFVPEKLKAIGQQARLDAQQHASWDGLARRLSEAAGTAPGLRI